MLFALAHLQRERALCGLWQQLLRVEAPADLVRETEPVEAARCEHDGVELPFVALAQARVDVAAQRLDPQRRLEREQLRLSAHGRSADAHAGADLVRAAQGVAWLVAPEVSAAGQARA